MLTSPIGVRCAIDALTVKNAGDASSKSSEALITSDITNASEWIYGGSLLDYKNNESSGQWSESYRLVY